VLRCLENCGRHERPAVGRKMSQIADSFDELSGRIIGENAV